MPQPGLCVETVHDAREDISRRFGGMGALYLSVTRNQLG